MPQYRVSNAPFRGPAAVLLVSIAIAATTGMSACGPLASTSRTAAFSGLVTAPVTYADVKPIFDNNCVMCHSAGDQGEPPADGLFLDAFPFRQVDKTGQVKSQTQQALVTKIVDRVSRHPGDATNGKGRMPPKGPPLEAGEIDALRQWLATGVH